MKSVLTKAQAIMTAKKENTKGHEPIMLRIRSAARSPRERERELIAGSHPWVLMPMSLPGRLRHAADRRAHLVLMDGSFVEPEPALSRLLKSASAGRRQRSQTPHSLKLPRRGGVPQTAG